MKKIIFIMFAMFTMIIVNIKPAHAVAFQVDNLIFLDTKIISNDIRFETTNKTYKEIIIDNYTGNNENIYVAIIPNETSATVVADQQYYNVKTLIFRYSGPYVLITLYNISLEYIQEFYIYMPNFEGTTFTLLPNESSYDQGYQQGLKDGNDNGVIVGYNNARQLFGINHEGTWLTAEQWGTIKYQDGINETIDEYAMRYDGHTYTAEQWGNIRYQEGINENADETALGVILGGVSALFGTALAFILQLGSIEILGISFNMILGIGLLLAVLFAVLGLIYGGK